MSGDPLNMVCPHTQLILSLATGQPALGDVQRKQVQIKCAFSFFFFSTNRALVIPRGPAHAAPFTSSSLLCHLWSWHWFKGVLVLRKKNTCRVLYGSWKGIKTAVSYILCSRDPFLQHTKEVTTSRTLCVQNTYDKEQNQERKGHLFHLVSQELNSL